MAGESAHWNGMMGEIHRDERDISAGSVFYVESRLALGHPTLPTIMISMTYAVPR